MCIGALKHLIIQDPLDQLVDLQVLEASPCGSFFRVQRDDRPNEWRHKDLFLYPDESIVCDLNKKANLTSRKKRPLQVVKGKRRGRKPGGKVVNGKYVSPGGGRG